MKHFWQGGQKNYNNLFITAYKVDVLCIHIMLGRISTYNYEFKHTTNKKEWEWTEVKRWNEKFFWSEPIIKPTFFSQGFWFQYMHWEINPK